MYRIFHPELAQPMAYSQSKDKEITNSQVLWLSNFLFIPPQIISKPCTLSYSVLFMYNYQNTKQDGTWINIQAWDSHQQQWEIKEGKILQQAQLKDATKNSASNLGH